MTDQFKFCYTCRAWDPDRMDKGTVGWCCMRAPVVVVPSNGKQQLGMWPMTKSGDWCCEWIPKDTLQTEETTND